MTLHVQGQRLGLIGVDGGNHNQCRGLRSAPEQREGGAAPAYEGCNNAHGVQMRRRSSGAKAQVLPTDFPSEDGSMGIAQVDV